MKKQYVELSDVDREYLDKLVSKGELKAKVYQRAFGLLELDRGKTYTEVSETIGVATQTLSIWAAKYRENGLEVLQDKPRPGRPVEIDGTQRAKSTVLALCLQPLNRLLVFGWHFSL